MTDDELNELPEPRRREWRVAGMIFFGLITVVVLWAAGMIIRPFVSAILIGAILVTLTYPLYVRLRNRLKGRSTAAALLMLLGLTLLLILPAAVCALLVVQQASGLAQHLQAADARQMISRIDLAERLRWVQRYIPTFDPSTVSLQKLVLPVLHNIPAWIASHGAVLLGSVVGLLFGFALVLLSAYFFYVEGESIVGELRALSPLPSRYDREFAHKFKDVIDATFRGQVMTSLAQAIATGAGMAMAGVPGALLWGFVAMILSLLPMLGAATVWVPATVYLFISASMGARGYGPALFLLVWGVVVVSTIDNIVRPWAMRGKTQIPAIPLLIAVLGGMQAFGFIGLVIGPLVFSLLMSIIDIYKQSFRLSSNGPGHAE
jgi:predicted PurR-regulated permease PerM